MSKKPKKRTKRYHGEDAKQAAAPASAPVVHRYEAVERSAAGEWYQSRKKLIRFGAIAAGIAGGSILVILELFQIFF